MKIIKDKKIIALAIILMVFTIGYFIIANHISYAFSEEFDSSYVYDKTIEIIKEAAISYANQKDELFKEDNIVYVKVQDLIDHNLLATNEDGNIINPLKKEENLNSNIIKIKKNKDGISAEVDS